MSKWSLNFRPERCHIVFKSRRSFVTGQNCPLLISLLEMMKRSWKSGRGGEGRGVSERGENEFDDGEEAF